MACPGTQRTPPATHGIPGIIILTLGLFVQMGQSPVVHQVLAAQYDDINVAKGWPGSAYLLIILLILHSYLLRQ